MLKYKRILVYLVLLIPFSSLVGQSIPFKDWNKCFIDESMIVCGEDQTKIHEDFDGPLDPEVWGTYYYYGGWQVQDDNFLYRRLHTNSAEAIIRDENVTFDVSDNTGSNDGKVGRIRMEKVDYETNTWTAPNDDGVVVTVKRDYNSGVLWSKEKFSYSHFKIRSKNPDQGNLFTAFWMWNVQELDVTDVAGRNEFYVATYDSYKDGFGYSNRVTGYDLTEWHTYSADWTPYVITWKIDEGEANEAILGKLYRYYDAEGNPLEFNCGDVIPSGLYFENPLYLEAMKTMSVIASFHPSKLCWKSNGPCHDMCDPDDDPETHCGSSLPDDFVSADYLIDYVTVTQKSYDQVSLKSQCANTCDNAPICFTLDSESLVFRVDGLSYDFGQIVSLENATLVPSFPGEVCIVISDASKAAVLQIEVIDNLGNTYIVEKSFINNTEPEILISGECNEYFCINPNGYCGDYQVNIDGEFEQVESTIEGAGGNEVTCLECYVAKNNCIIPTITYDKCGETITKGVTPAQGQFIVVEDNHCNGKISLEKPSCDGQSTSSVTAVNKWGSESSVDFDFTFIEVPDLETADENDTKTIEVVDIMLDNLFFLRHIIIEVADDCGNIVSEFIYELEVCDTENCCPVGSEWDGSSCYIGTYIPDGYDDFFIENSLYTHYGPLGAGDCPTGSVDDEAHCYFGELFPEGYDGFIFENKLYVHDDCSVEFCCPDGTEWDGKNCVSSDHPFGKADGWIDDQGNIYLQPDNTIEWCTWKPCYCSHDWNPAANRCETGQTVPLGFTGVIEDGNFVLDPNCNTCCPDGFEFDGKDCVQRIDLISPPLPAGGGAITIESDCKTYGFENACCPRGFIRGKDFCLLDYNPDYEIEIFEDYLTILTKSSRCSDNVDNRSLSSAENLNHMNDLALEVSVFPNPFSDKFSIVLKEQAQNVEVVVTSLEGKILYSELFINSDEMINVNANLTSGIYILKVSVDSLHTTTRLIKI